MPFLFIFSHGYVAPALLISFLYTKALTNYVATTTSIDDHPPLICSSHLNKQTNFLSLYNVSVPWLCVHTIRSGHINIHSLLEYPKTKEVLKSSYFSINFPFIVVKKPPVWKSISQCFYLCFPVVYPNKSRRCCFIWNTQTIYTSSIYHSVWTHKKTTAQSLSTFKLLCVGVCLTTPVILTSHF